MQQIQLLARRRGATLVEAGIVVAITAIVAGVSAPSLRSLIENRRLDAAATRLAADIQLARNEAIARNLPVRLAVQTTAGCWTVHTGGAGDCVCAANGVTACADTARAVKTVALPAAEGISVASSAASLAFDPVHGTSTPTGTLRLVDLRGREVRHVVNVMGRTRSCSPNAALPGYRAC